MSRGMMCDVGFGLQLFIYFSICNTNYPLLTTEFYIHTCTCMQPHSVVFGVNFSIILTN